MDVGGSSGISTVEWQDGGHSYDAMDYIRDPCPGRATRYFVIDMMFARDSKLATGATLIADDQIPD